jgi:hypothetical protein
MTQDVDQESDRQAIFDETFSKLMDRFGEACQELGIKNAIAIAKADNFDEPMVFYVAPHIVDAAALMAKVLRQVKTEINNNLNTEAE